MTNEIEKMTALVERSNVAYISSTDDAGYPNIKAMLALHHDDLFTHYFSTKLTCNRTQQFLKNPKTCVYFCDEPRFLGLMLVGEIKVLTDHEHKALLWRDGFEIYYPDGIDTEDYCIYKFIAYKANFYEGLINIDITKEEYEHAKI